MSEKLEGLIQETVSVLENLKKVQLDLLERKDIISEEQFASEYFKVIDPIINNVLGMRERMNRIYFELISSGEMLEETPQEIEKIEEELKEINSKVAERFGGEEKCLKISTAHYEKLASDIRKEMELKVPPLFIFTLRLKSPHYLIYVVITT